MAWGPADAVLVVGDTYGLVRVRQVGKERSGVTPTVQTVSVTSNTGTGGVKVPNSLSLLESECTSVSINKSTNTDAKGAAGDDAGVDCHCTR